MGEAGDVDFGREAFKGFCAKVGTYLFGFAATAYFARELGPAAFGGYFLLLSIVAFANRVPQGIGGACQKRISEVDSPDGELLGVVVPRPYAPSDLFGLVVLGAASYGACVVALDGTVRRTLRGVLAGVRTTVDDAAAWSSSPDS